MSRLTKWWPVISSKIIYLIESSDGRDLGVWSFNKYLDGVLIHADMGKDCRGKRAAESIKSAFEWIFSNTSNEKVYAKIHIAKRAASHFVIHSGMEFTHRNDEHKFYEVRK